MYVNLDIVLCDTMLYLMNIGYDFYNWMGTGLVLPDTIQLLLTPRAFRSSNVNNIKRGRLFAIDNDAFGGKFNEKNFFSLLHRSKDLISNSLFVAVPDVLGSAENTLKLFPRYSNRIKKLGYKVAFVAQDGQDKLPFPDMFDVLFVGGTDQFKLGAGARNCITRAKELGKKVHVGRVNSRKRCLYFNHLGVDSVDGSKIKFKPNTVVYKIIDWMKECNK